MIEIKAPKIDQLLIKNDFILKLKNLIKIFKG